MSTNQNPSVPTFNSYHFFNDVIDHAIKKYNLDPYESVYLKSTYFFVLFDLRNINELLERDEVYFNFKSLKRMSYECINLFKNNYFSKVSHAYLLSKFRDKLSMKKAQNTLTFELNSMIINILDTDEIDKKLNFEKEIYECAQYVLKRFNAKFIPLELYLVVIYEVYLIYYENKELFKDLLDFDNKNLAYEVLTRQLLTIRKKIRLDDGNISILTKPPRKDDFRFNMLVNTFDATCSLKLLTAYFGNKVWHKQIIAYDEQEENEYFCFHEEPYIKVVINERKFKRISLNTSDTTMFLTDEFRSEFFKIWEDRLRKEEFAFFIENVKTAILEKRIEIRFQVSKHSNIDLKKIVNGIRDTSGFDYGDGEC